MQTTLGIDINYYLRVNYSTIIKLVDAMGGIDIAQVLADLMEIMKENGISLPHGVTMLCRGLAHVEGVLAQISPDINMFQIAVTRFTEDSVRQLDWKKELEKSGRLLYRTARKGAEIP